MQRQRVLKNFWFILILPLQNILAEAPHVKVGVHKAPIILSADKDLKRLPPFYISQARLFSSDSKGQAVQIPYQIDERDDWGDFALPTGTNPNQNLVDGIFNKTDELSFMGEDVGTATLPTKWDVTKPDHLFQILLTKKAADGTQLQQGAVYIGVYTHAKIPDPNPKTYVHFDLDKNEIQTSRYYYGFEPENYLVVRGIDIKHPDPVRLIYNSSFFLHADFRYFLTFDITHNEIKSSLDAYKNGPIRSIARINFNYRFAKLNFDLGMYTEASFFSNSVILPAIIDNPLDKDNGVVRLNTGSLFYYGFSFVENPTNIDLKTNMPKFKKSLLASLLSSPRVESQYFVTIDNPKYMIFIEFNPSPAMIEDKNYPLVYTEDIDGNSLITDRKHVGQLGSSPVNVAIALDLQNFKKGEHHVFFRLFVENEHDADLLNDLKELSLWHVDLQKIPMLEKADAAGKERPALKKMEVWEGTAHKKNNGKHS